jgi:hypothetical protein
MNDELALVPPPLATPKELKDSGVEAPDGVIDHALRSASAAVRTYCTRGVPDPVPESIRVVVLALAARMARNPEGINAETIGGYSYRMPRDRIGLMLTADERKLLEGCGCRDRAASLPIREPSLPYAVEPVFRPRVNPLATTAEEPVE